MIVCDQCGHRNEAGSRFCSNCGHRLVAGDEPLPSVEQGTPSSQPDVVPTVSGLPPQMAAPPVPPRRVEPLPASRGPSTGDLAPTDPEWRMSSAGPLPDPPRRRRWLWILLAIVGACVLVCVGVSIFFSTETGSRLFSDLQTQSANLEASGTPGE